MKKTTLLTALAVAIVTSGCASFAEDIAPQSVSPMQYQDYDCRQTHAELKRVTDRESELTLRLDKKAKDDMMQATIGVMLFWPALFLLEGGDGPEAAEYARVKGEREALSKALIDKNCPVVASADAKM